jgi:hypothetical protein
MNKETPTPEEVKHILSFIETRPDYDTWIRIISAVGNTFDKNTALDILHSRFRDEKPNEHAIKLNYRLSNISLATLVYYAKQRGYKGTSKKNFNYIPFNRTTKQTEENKISFQNLNENLIYRFDEATEERLAIMEYEGKLTRAEAQKIICSNVPELPKERLYRIAVNEKVKNKEKDYKRLNENFENRLLSAYEIADKISKGYSIICSKIRSEKGKVKRKNENWLCSELIALDIDTGLTIEKAFEIPETNNALLIYTSPSHTPEKHRFRIIFDLPYLETDSERYKIILSKFIEIYGADKQCKDLCRIYFGNDNATIYLIRTGEIFEFKNGVLQNGNN